jgi:hypothetical protein
MLHVRATGALTVACALAGCPAPPLDDNTDWDTPPFDAVAGDLSFGVAPTCAPESVVDLNASATRAGSLLQLLVDTRNTRNDQHPACVPQDSTEVILRYTSPSLADHRVAAIRVTTITPQTIANASGVDDPVPDPTTYDTVVSIRFACDGRDIDCNADAFFQDAQGIVHKTHRSNVYEVGVTPETVYFVVVDGFAGNRGTALVTLEEIATLGVPGAPCVPIPLERAHDPTAQTAYFRCPERGYVCRPGAAADGTDLCVPVLPLGAPCDPDGRFSVCDRASEGAICAQNPTLATDVKCALPGTAAGTPCRGVRGGVDRCDAGLYCSQQPPDSLAPDECVSIRVRGDSCDPEPYGAINHCDVGLVCCADSPDAGAETVCEPMGASNCYPVRDL